MAPFRAEAAGTHLEFCGQTIQSVEQAMQEYAYRNLRDDRVGDFPQYTLIDMATGNIVRTGMHVELSYNKKTKGFDYIVR